VFGVLSGLIILVDVFRLVTGRMRPEDLVMVRESEEQDEAEALQRHVTAKNRNRSQADRPNGEHRP